MADWFFNSKLGAAGAASDELFVQIRIPGGSNVLFASVPEPGTPVLVVTVTVINSIGRYMR